MLNGPARRGRLARSGGIYEGATGDLVLLDNIVAAGPLRGVRDLPGAAHRLILEPSDIEMVMVNGVAI